MRHVVDANSAASASADYTELRAFAESLALGTYAQGRADAGDTLLVSASGTPASTTATVEITWHLEGNIVGDGKLVLYSNYNITNPCDFNAYPTVGTFEITTAGVVDELVTFVYESVPIGEEWQLYTRLTVGSEDPFVGAVDFSNSATLVKTQVFVDDFPIEFQIVGLSGTTYPVPEPATAILALSGLILIFGRRR